jgi:hypothetical protein
MGETGQSATVCEGISANAGKKPYSPKTYLDWLSQKPAIGGDGLRRLAPFTPVNKGREALTNRYRHLKTADGKCLIDK